MLHVCLRSLLGLVFVATGLLKLIDISAFAEALGDFGIVADELVVPTAWLISLLELFAGFGLIAGIRGSLAVVTGMLVLFIGVLSYGIALGFDIDCGCFGPAFSVDLRSQRMIDIGMVIICALVFVTRPKNPRQHRQPTTDPSPSEGTTA